VLPQPTECNRAFDPGAEILAAAASRQKRRIDALDVNPIVLHGFDAVCDLDDLARGDIGIGEGTIGTNFFMLPPDLPSSRRAS
jgi:hypothetical protein